VDDGREATVKGRPGSERIVETSDSGFRDYVAWHDDYDRPGSAMHLRLLVVEDLIAHALDQAPPGPIRVISMCAGQGRDLVTVARRHRRGADLVGRHVVIDSQNVATARAAITAGDLSALDVSQADAGWSDAYVGSAPADVVLACGIFGNVTDDDVKHTIEFLPAICAPGGWVIWTRGPRGDDILTRIEGWFHDAGFEPTALVVGQGGLFGVGAARFIGRARELRAGVRLFEFFR
jgi:hypothetical protein